MRDAAYLRVLRGDRGSERLVLAVLAPVYSTRVSVAVVGSRERFENETHCNAKAGRLLSADVTASARASAGSSDAAESPE